MSQMQWIDKAVGIMYDPVLSKKKQKDIYTTLDSFTFSFPDKPDVSVTVPAGFQSDGASTPRIFWSIIPPWGIYGQAAVLHDYLCQTRSVVNDSGEVLRVDYRTIDRAMYYAMKDLGTPIWKRALIYGAIRAYHFLTQLG